MPWLDLSEAIEDPYLEDSFTVVRRLQTVDTHGEPVTTVTDTFREVGGVVTPTGNNSLVRQEAFESQQNAIQVITRFRLRAAGKDKQGNNWLPDIIQWDDGSYIVRVLNEYTRLGAGFVQAECIMIDYNQVPDSSSPEDCT